MMILRLMVIVLWSLTALPVRANPDLCETAAHRAARDSGVPADVLLAIALTETGRTLNGRVRPWPWTANAEGQGHWFATRDEALSFARHLLSRDQPLFDLGCFQINWRWHGQHFFSPEALLDPLTAARYAAALLASLHAELGSWEAAAGAYHSRNPALAARYRARFAELRAGLRDRPAPPGDPQPVAPQRLNAFPLLAGAASGPSLVPASLPASRALFEVRR